MKRHPFLALLAAAQLAAPALAQSQAPSKPSKPTGGVIGRIFDERTSEILTQVLVVLDSARHDVMISSQGRFVISNLAPGRHRLEIRSIGYRPSILEFILLDGQVLEREFAMVFTGDRLPELAVEARNSKLLSRFADFERRRQNGMGAFITRDEIRARGYMNMGDALRTVKGVRVDCGVIECSIHMTRSSPGCYPTFYVDGRHVNSFAESTPINDVQGIEVYRGAAELPGEFSGDKGMCGVVVIWTRAAP